MMMSSKHKLASDVVVTPKRSRKVLSLYEKVELLDRLAQGESAASVARHYGINESSVRTIKKSDAVIRASVAGGAPKSAKVTFVSRDANLEKMENDLVLWIDDQTQKKVPLSSHSIRKKAKSIYDLLVEKSAGEGSSNSSPLKFKASKGWFENFKRRQRLQNVEVVEDLTDSLPLISFQPELNKLIEDKGFNPEEVFNPCEVGFSKKRTPMRTYLSKQEGDEFTNPSQEELNKIVADKGFNPDEMLNAVETGHSKRRMPMRTYLARQEGEDEVTEVKVELKPYMVNTCWGDLWKDVIDDFEEMPPAKNDELQTNQLAQDVHGESSDEVVLVEAVLQPSLKEGSTNDSLNKSNETVCDLDGNKVTEEEDGSNLTLDYLNKIVQAGRMLSDMVCEVDPVAERRLKFKQKLELAMRPYKELQRILQRKKNPPIRLGFLKKRVSAALSKTNSTLVPSSATNTIP